MNNLYLTPTELTQQQFAPFGQVIDTTNTSPLIINQGFAEKFPYLANLDTHEHNGQTAVHIFVPKQRTFPLVIDMLEKHPHWSQAFLPIHQSPFLIVVAPPSDKPDIEQIRAFITQPGQGVIYARNVWHFPLISLAEGLPFFVLDRDDRDANEKQLIPCIECQITPTITVQLTKKQKNNYA